MFICVAVMAHTLLVCDVCKVYSLSIYDESTVCTVFMCEVCMLHTMFIYELSTVRKRGVWIFVALKLESGSDYISRILYIKV